MIGKSTEKLANSLPDSKRIRPLHIKTMLYICSLMKTYTYLGAFAVIMAFALTYSLVAHAQNITSNASNAAGNASAQMNQTGSEIGKNASDLGAKIVNGTEDLGKKIAGGLGSLLGNASEKLNESAK